MKKLFKTLCMIVTMFGLTLAGCALSLQADRAGESLHLEIHPTSKEL